VYWRGAGRWIAPVAPVLWGVTLYTQAPDYCFCRPVFIDEALYVRRRAGARTLCLGPSLLSADTNVFVSLRHLVGGRLKAAKAGRWAGVSYDQL